MAQEYVDNSSLPNLFLFEGSVPQQQELRLDPSSLSSQAQAGDTYVPGAPSLWGGWKAPSCAPNMSLWPWVTAPK